MTQHNETRSDGSELREGLSTEVQSALKDAAQVLTDILIDVPLDKGMQLKVERTLTGLRAAINGLSGPNRQPTDSSPVNS